MRSVLPTFTLGIEKFPSKSVAVPDEVPTTKTDAPMIGSPSESTTVPVHAETCWFAAIVDCAETVKVPPAASIPHARTLIKFFGIILH